MFLSTEEREPDGETLPVPEVGERRGAGEASGSDGHDQGRQVSEDSEEHGHCGPLQVRAASVINEQHAHDLFFSWLPKIDYPVISFGERGSLLIQGKCFSKGEVNEIH